MLGLGAGDGELPELPVVGLEQLNHRFHVDLLQVEKWNITTISTIALHPIRSLRS